MSGVDTRHLSRDALLLMADVRRDADATVHRVKVRNLSSGGMMAEGDMAVVRGERLSVELRNLPVVEASVAWVQEGRFGVAFGREIDPKAPRTAVGNNDLASPRFVRPSTIAPGSPSTDFANFRKL